MQFGTQFQYATSIGEYAPTRSANGTWVNGRRVIEAEVAPGDDIRLGDCRLRI